MDTGYGYRIGLELEVWAVGEVLRLLLSSFLFPLAPKQFGRAERDARPARKTCVLA